MVKSIRKDHQWIKFILPDAREIKILVRDDQYSKKKSKVVIDCPEETKIDFEDNDNIGNC